MIGIIHFYGFISTMQDWIMNNTIVILLSLHKDKAITIGNSNFARNSN